MSQIKLKYPLKINNSILSKGKTGENIIINNNTISIFPNIKYNPKSNQVLCKFEGFEEIILDKKQIEKI